MRRLSSTADDRVSALLDIGDVDFEFALRACALRGRAGKQRRFQRRQIVLPTFPGVTDAKAAL